MSDLQDNKSKLVGVLDLGTNTFHMIIHRVSKHWAEEVFRKRHIVFLSDQGIETISEKAKNRAYDAIRDFAKELKQFENVSLKIIATAALRTASNGPLIANYISNLLGAEVEIIGGEREAELIGKGVLYGMKSLENSLIVDIGGGSVEFIHVENNQIKVAMSYSIGIGVLFKKFQHSEPILPDEIHAIKTYLSETTKDLIKYLQIHKVEQLVGASGSFELLPKLNLQENEEIDQTTSSCVSQEDFVKIRDMIWSKNIAQRREIPNLPEMRVQLSVVSFIIVDWILQLVPTDKIWISTYAVKEGVIAELIEE